METFDQSLKHLLEHEPEAFVQFALKGCATAFTAMKAYIRKEDLMQSVLYREIFAEGELKGELRGLRQAITDLCEVLGIELTPEREAQLRELDLEGLTALRTHLKRDRAW